MPPGQGSQTRKTPRLLGYSITLRRLKHEEWVPGLTAGGQELDVDIPWVEGDQKIYRNRPEMPSIPPKRTSGTHHLSPCPMIVMRSRMTLWCTTPLRPDIPPGGNETGEKEETTAWLIEGDVGRDTMARMDDARS